MSGMADVDTYVHRSGRTGRAGKKGICITLYTNRQRDQLDMIERKIGNKFIMKDPPHQDDLLKASASKALAEIINVDPAMIEIFRETASEMLETMKPEACLAAALACITGHTKPPRRTSLMSGVPDYVTVLFTSSNFIRAKGYVWNALNRDIPESIANDIKQLTITEDSMGVCFDLPIAGLEALEKKIEESGMNCPYSIPKTLPKLQQSAYQIRQQSVGGRGRGGGSGRGGRGRGGRGRRY
ncbi:dead deah box rna [Plasmopara halstedii]|uniref:RNA helicase n=1 Tax=Plasmopara halstedii TaxID=4781 RepID=A0A0P1AM61_PLAHL|nr:dead deah box rna [Plasmopara halstedii]CEG42529.1 dead deah box rna [Plasmopara halstedii]|eukprot:XP_024578898.1 dead deah box rna [Plasmopara halstedii]